MSRFRDIAEGAREGLEGLLGRIRSGTEELSGVDADELAAELEARKAASPRKPSANSRASSADGSPSAHAKREKAAQIREDRVRGQRERRESAARAASEAAFRQAKERAAREAEQSYQQFRSSVGAEGTPGKNTRRPSIFGEDRELAKHYKTLHVPYGTEFAEVKSAYRKLMRKYHPDLHNQSDKKQKAATELTVHVTGAFNALEKHLKD